MLRAFQDRLRAEDDDDDEVVLFLIGKGVHFSLHKDAGLNTLNTAFNFFFPLFYHFG
jgi:hypothetical protein